MKQVIDIPAEVCPLLVRPYLNNAMVKIDTQPLPAYVSQLAVENTELHDTVSVYKDFAASLCHTLNMSLESALPDIAARVSKLQEQKTDDGGFGQFQNDILRVLNVAGTGYSTTYILELVRSRAIARVRFEKLLKHVQNFTQELHEDDFISLKEE